MSLRRLLTVVAALVVLAPGTAAAQETQVVARDVPLDAARASATRTAPTSFTMVGLHWRGSGRVWFRTAREPGSFGSWHAAQPEEEDVPDVGSDERDASAGWHVGNAWWVGESRLIQYRVSGQVTRLRTFFVDSRVTAADRSAVSANKTASASVSVAARAARPPIIRRSGWNADESIVRAKPAIAERLRFAVVHHTAGSNSYSKSQSAAIVRGIQRYHVLGNGWNDIGYNFLVDKYGQIFEGRGGGIANNVVGAHAGGFNTGSVGVSVIGNFDSAGLSTAAKSALQKLLAWRLDVGHVFPRGSVDVVSGGSSRYPAGVHVRLRNVNGHRDSSATSCPGANIYKQLGTIARNVTQLGLPKLYDPRVNGSVGDLVRFTGRLSASRAWLVEVKDASGGVVAQGSGSGTAIDWTWDSTAVPIASYTYTISSGAAVRPASYPIPGPPPLAITGFKVKPVALTPNGDWNNESTSVRFGLSRRAVVGVRVLNTGTGNLVRTLLASAERPAGNRTVGWDAKTAGGAIVSDGPYQVEVTAEGGGESAIRKADVVVDRTLGEFSATPSLLGKTGSLQIGYTLTRQATVKVEIRRKGKTVRRLFGGSRPAGAYVVPWNGKSASGKRLADGTYSAVALATTSLGTRLLARPFRMDATAPSVSILGFRRSSGVARLRLSFSEGAWVRIFFGTSRWNDGGSVIREWKAGQHTFSRRGNWKVFRIVAKDEALNRSSRIYRAPR